METKIKEKRIEELNSIISEKEINSVWEESGAFFGEEEDRRKILAESLLKVVCGYANGAMSNHLLRKFGLVTKQRGVIKQKGQMYLSAFYLS